MKFTIILLFTAMLFSNLIFGKDKINFDVSDAKFIDYMESFIDKKISDLVGDLINSGNYYYDTREEVNVSGSLLGWELTFSKTLSIIVYINKFECKDYILLPKIKYQYDRFDFNHFQKEKISQIMIRQNIAKDPLEHFYKWIILPREKEKSNKNIKK